MAAMAATKEREHNPALPVATVTGKRQRIDRAVSAGIRSQGVGLSECTKDHINDPQDRLGVPTNGLG